MSIIQSIILGIVQGLTEFLPVSSSAHLVLIPYLFKWNLPASQVFPFDVLVQLGTLAAVILFFWQDLWLIIKEFISGIIKRKPFATLEARMGWYLILATIPAGLAGLFLKSKVEAAFSSPTLTALFLFVTAILLVIAEAVGRRQKNLSQLTWLDSLWIGVFQAVSIFPGVSRSGSTMAGGMTRQFDRPSAARFSFLMSIPIMLAAGALSVKDLLDVPNLSSFLPVMAIGFLTAGVVGYFSIRWLLSFIQKRSLIYFAVYCAAFASLVLAISAFRSPSVSQANSNPQTPTGSVDSAVALQLAYTPALNGWGHHFSTCANEQTGFSMVVQELPTSSLDSTHANVMLRLGTPQKLSLPSYTLGTERIAMIVNPTNTLQDLTLGLVQQVLGASISSWVDLQSACPECFAGDLPGDVKDSPIALNFYASGEDIQTLMESALLTGVLPARAQALLIPDPAAMIETVSSSPQAIGFVPASSLTNTVKEFIISDIDPSQLNVPILAITQTQPTGSTLSWLNCVQNSLLP